MGLSVWLPATIHGGFHDAPSGDCGVLAQIQCPEETEGEAGDGTLPYPEMVPFHREAPTAITEQSSYPGWS